MSKPTDNQPDDSCIVIADGLESIGFLRPIGRGFDVFAALGDSFVPVGTAATRANAMSLLAAPPPEREAC
jgi:hypothetical protein